MRSRPMWDVPFPVAERLDDEEEEGQLVGEEEAFGVGQGAAADLVVVADRGHRDPLVVVERRLVGAAHDVEALLVGHVGERDLDRDEGGAVGGLDVDG